LEGSMAPVGGRVRQTTRSPSSKRRLGIAQFVQAVIRRPVGLEPFPELVDG